MKKKWVYKLGASLLALSLVTACGTTDNNDDTPEAPLNQNDEENNDLNEDQNRDDNLENNNDTDPDMNNDDRNNDDNNR